MRPRAVGAGGGRRSWSCTAVQSGEGNRDPKPGSLAVLESETWTHVLTDGRRHAALCREETTADCGGRGPRPRQTSCSGNGSSDADRKCPPRDIMRTGSAVARCRVRPAAPVRDTQCGFRLFRSEVIRRLPLMSRATRSRPRCWSRCGGTAAATGPRRFRRFTAARQQAASGPRHNANLFPRGVLSGSSSACDLPPATDLARHAPVEPRRWTLHGLNNGAYFQGDLRPGAGAAAPCRTRSGTAARGSPGD